MLLGLGSGILNVGIRWRVLDVGVGGDVLTDTPPVVWHRRWGTY